MANLVGNDQGAMMARHGRMSLQNARSIVSPTVSTKPLQEVYRSAGSTSCLDAMKEARGA
jgi:hypothetical protein